MSEKLIVPFTDEKTIKREPVSLHIDEKTGPNFRHSRVFGVFDSGQIVMASNLHAENIHILTENNDTQWDVSPPLFNLERERTYPRSLSATSTKILIGTSTAGVLEYTYKRYGENTYFWGLNHKYEFQYNEVTSVQIFDDGSFVYSDEGNNIILYNPSSANYHQIKHSVENPNSGISDLVIIPSETLQGLLPENRILMEALHSFDSNSVPVSRATRPTSGFLAGSYLGNISLYKVNPRLDRILQEIELPKLDIGSEREMYSMTAIPGGLATLDFDQNGEKLYCLRIWGIKEGRFDNLANYDIDNKRFRIHSLPNGRLLLAGNNLLEIWTDTAASQKITPPLE